MITIPGRLYSSKNGKQIKHLRDNSKPSGKRTILAKSDKAHENFTSLQILMLDANRKGEWLRMQIGKPYPLKVKFTYYPPDHGEFDFMNIFQNMADAMQAAGWLPNDNYKYFVPVFDPVVVVDKKNPRVEITVL